MTPVVGGFVTVRGDGPRVCKVVAVDDEGQCVLLHTGCWEAFCKLTVLTPVALCKAIVANRKLSQRLLEEAADMEQFLNTIRGQ